jgi:flagellar basal-body rod modification protein FlgD
MITPTSTTAVTDPLAVTASTKPNSPAPTSDALTSTDTFLKLLVAQLRNQDPLNPTDGVQFLTQLTQFSSLEQTLGMKQDLDAIRQQLQTAASVSTKPSGNTVQQP